MEKKASLKHVPKNELSRRDFLLWSGQLGIVAMSLPATRSLGLAADTPRTQKTGYEYAAGDVVLPFSYSATRSPAPKPNNLDFSNQVSPDNCEVFVRIED